VTYAGSRVLVTGADGFIGSHLTEALVAGGADVIALVLYNSFDRFGWLDDVPDAVRRRVKIVRGDVRDAAFMRRLIEVQDIVFHLAALIAIPHSYLSPQAYVETNVLGTLNVLEAARDSGVKRVIVTSTSEVYGTAITLPMTEDHPLQGQSPYSASKIGADMMAESFARSFSLPVVILRPFNTFGPRQSERAVIPTVIRQALDPACPHLAIGDVSPMRDFTFVDDAVAAFLAVGESESIAFGRPYNAGSGKAVAIRELIDLVCELTECHKTVEQETVRLRPERSEVRTLLADSSRLSAETGWHPTVELRQGLQRTIAWWRNRLADGQVRAGGSYMT
jgi:NAD dependent epimerase/dehydratase